MLSRGVAIPQAVDLGLPKDRESELSTRMNAFIALFSDHGYNIIYG